MYWFLYDSGLRHERVKYAYIFDESQPIYAYKRYGYKKERISCAEYHVQNHHVLLLKRS